MVAAFKLGNHGLVGGSPHEAPGQHGGLGSRVADHGQFGAGHTRDQPLGKFHFPRVGHPIAHAQLALFMQGFQDRLRTMTQHVHAVRHGAVDIAVAVDIPGVGAFAALDINRVGLHFACPAHQTAGNQVFGLLPVFA